MAEKFGRHLGVVEEKDQNNVQDVNEKSANPAIDAEKCQKISSAERSSPRYSEKYASHSDQNMRVLPLSANLRGGP